MAWILGICGLVFGAAMGGPWGALILCVVGALVGKWINRLDDERVRAHAADQPSPASTLANADGRPSLDEFLSLREEVLALRRRVDLLEKRRSEPEVRR